MNLKSAPVTILLGSVGLVLLVALGWFALISPAMGAISDNGEARIAAQDRSTAMGLQLAKLRRQADELPTTEKQARKLDEMWPATADQPGFIAQINQAADQAGIAADDLTVLNPGVPTKLSALTVDGAPAAEADPEAEVAPLGISDIAVQDVTIGAVGSYEQLTELLAALEKMPRSFLVETSTVTADDSEDAQGLTLTVVGKTFVAPPLDPATGS